MKLHPFTPLCRLLVLPVLWLLSTLAVQAGHTIRVKVADGFDLPVGKPDGAGYYTARGYMPNAHQGEDWNGNGGGDSDLGDPVYATADGVVVYSEDYRRSWGNLLIIRHAYRGEGGAIQFADSVYAHLHQRKVRLYQMVKRGETVGTIGTAHGLYPAHLHFEIRKNLNIGPFQTTFARDYSNYFSPRQFIAQRRQLKGGDTTVVPVDTFKGQGGETVASNPDSIRRDIPVRDPRVAARDSAAASQKREQDMKKLIEENRRKVDAMKEEDMDAFWSRVKSRLGKKKP